jgi:Methyltransferase domain
VSWADIPGWTCPAMLELYDEIAATLNKGSLFVEVGAAYGRSLAYMANRAWPNGEPILCAVDTWRDFVGFDNLSVTAIGEINRYPTMHLAFWGFIGEHVTPQRQEMFRAFRGASVNAAKSFHDGSVQAVFIDDDHSYEGCAASIAAWLPKVRPDGILAGHDYNPHFPGVIRAVQETFGARAEIRGIAEWGNVWVVRVPE